VSAEKWAEKAVGAALFLAIVAVMACAGYMSRVGCPACLAEFAGNGVKLDVLALQLPANEDELERTLYLPKPFSKDVRQVYERQTKVDDVFLWLYPAQFVLACFYFALASQTKPGRLLLAAASAAMVVAGIFDHHENAFIHTMVGDSNPRLDQLAILVRHASIEKWVFFGSASSLAAAGLVLDILGRRPIPGIKATGLTENAAMVVCVTLLLVSAPAMAGTATGNREVIRLSGVAYSLFLVALLWLLYLKPWAERIDGWLRRRFGVHQ